MSCVGLVIYCGALVVAVYLAVVSFSNIKAERSEERRVGKEC